jgi:hypothetical protein
MLSGFFHFLHILVHYIELAFTSIGERVSEPNETTKKQKSMGLF